MAVFLSTFQRFLSLTDRGVHYLILACSTATVHRAGTTAGNYISDRSSSRILAPPGGASSITFG